MAGGSGGSPAAGPRRLRLPVPVSIITGALAAGKTTFIAGLLRSRPPGELWAVLVNEFGAAGLDAALLEGGAAGPAAAQQAEQQQQGSAGVHIRQLAGGCLCCALSSVTATAIAQLLRNVKPDRLLIEPSGLAHPAALLDMLQGGHLASALSLQPVVCLVDATQFARGAGGPAACLAGQLLLDQISIADVLVGSKADLCDAANLAGFHGWAQQLFPPKALVATAAAGKLQGAPLSALLSWPPAAESSASDGGGYGQEATAQPAASGRQQQQEQQVPVRRVRRVPASQPWLSSSEGVEEDGAAGDDAAAPSQPLRKEVRDGTGAHAACGWILHRDCVFNRARLQALLQALLPRVLRLKGVFRVSPKLWVAVSAAPTPAAGGSSSSSSSDCNSSGHAGSSSGVQHEKPEPPPVELREIAYRRDSRVEVILDTAAAAALAAAAAEGSGVACEAASGDGGSLEAQVGGLSLGGSPASGSSGMSSEAMPIDAALGRATACDWSALEALLLATLESPA
ncbi:hypothetical protein ABPG75_007478 [Micractinium tetrahymenae]